MAARRLCEALPGAGPSRESLQASAALRLVPTGVKPSAPSDSRDGSGPGHTQSARLTRGQRPL